MKSARIIQFTKIDPISNIKLRLIFIEETESYKETTDTHTQNQTKMISQGILPNLHKPDSLNDS